MLGRDRNDQLSLTQRFIAREGNHVAPRGGQDHSVEARLRFSAVGQKPAVSVALRLWTLGHVGDFEILKDVEAIGHIGDEAMTRLVRVVLSGILFVPLIASSFLLGFAAIP